MLKLFLIVLILFSNRVFSEIEVCPEIYLIENDQIDFSDTEKKLACGDKNSDAYKDIPFYQAEFFIKAFLESRSYLNPTFKVEGKKLLINPGKIAKLKSVEVIPENEGTIRLKKEINRLHSGDELNPSLLNQIESDTVSSLRHYGYPCPKVSSEAETDENIVTITLSNIHEQTFGTINKKSIPGLRENALDRYYPFKETDRYDGQLLDLTEKRMIRSEVIQGTYFLESCTDQGMNLKISQHFLTGPPRTLRFGAGASTEVGPMARLRWANNRSGSMASFIGANLQASLRNQSFVFTTDSYLWHKRPRLSLLSEAQVKRESQLEFEEINYKVKSVFKWTADRLSRNWQYAIGPALEAGTYRSQDLSSTRSYATGAFVGGIKWMSHSYEFFDIHPEEGDIFQFDFNYRNRAFGFSEELLRLDTTFAKLIRLRNSGRGALILGTRINAGTSWVNDDVDLQSLPPSMKFYGGGSDDVRGFHLLTLPKNEGAGALTKIGGKLEVRRTRFFHETVEAFIFYDGAYFGDKSWSTVPRFWHSPGAGLRWLSPIGLVQSFYARSLVTKPYFDHGDLYYIGLGGTF